MRDPSEIENPVRGKLGGERRRSHLVWGGVLATGVLARFTLHFEGIDG
jgi:hypothetical protein